MSELVENINVTLAENEPEDMEVTFTDATVVTVPIDATLTMEDRAADAKAVGDALALKADKTELASAITVNDQAANNQGRITVDATQIDMGGQTQQTVAAAIAAAAAAAGALTAENIPMSDDAGALTIAQALDVATAGTAETILYEDEGEATIKDVVDALFPVGAIWMTSGDNVPAFYGTWAEVRITATWEELTNGDRSYTAGTGAGTVHFWRRTA